MANKCEPTPGSDQAVLAVRFFGELEPVMQAVAGKVGKTVLGWPSIQPKVSSVQAVANGPVGRFALAVRERTSHFPDVTKGG